MATSTEVDWSVGHTIYVRMSVKADLLNNDVGSSPTLAMEAIILPKGETLEDFPEQTRAVLNSGGCRSFLLWSTGASWYAPSSRSGLITTPGIYDKGGNENLSDGIVRWHQATYLDLTRRGSYVEA